MAFVLSYDNETGKGNHKLFGTVETAYAFESPRRLLADFWRNVDLWRRGMNEVTIGISGG